MNIESSLQHDFIIPEEDKKLFWKWFENKAIQLPVIQVNTEKFASILKEARCYGNSQTIAISSNYKYYEGFLQLNDDFIPHGFNGNQSEYHDYTISAFPDNYYQNNRTLPSNYYGVLIPVEFINEYSPNVKALPNDNNSLIYSYFKNGSKTSE